MISCADAGNAEAAARTATRNFHELLLQGRYSDIYKTADIELQNTQSEAAFVSFLQHAASELTSAKSSRETHVGVVVRSQYTTVVLVYDIDLGERVLSEEIWWRVRTEATTLLDYRMQPKP